ncbi:MAG: GNAT family N-acetyltransferase [bacterium]
MTKKLVSKSIIKKIPLNDLDVFIDIVSKAYPGFNITSSEEKKKTRQRLIKLSRDPTIDHYGLYRGGKLLGGMRAYDFTMNLFSNEVLCGGVGLVAVDLLNKKEKVCKELILYFIQLFKRKGASLVSLYPFRPDFYRKMGFGYGTKINEYNITPTDLPRGTSKKHIHFLKQRDRKSFKECADRYFMRHHGMFSIKEHELDYFFERPEANTVVYKKGKKILGYLSFVFKRVDDGNLLRNNIVIRELVYENRDALSELLTFLHTQGDQVHRIIYPTQDDSFHFLPSDPRDGSGHMIPVISHQSNLQGVGVMYRVIDTKGIFRLLKKHNFNEQNCRLKITLKDSFLPHNAGSFVVHFKDGFSVLACGGKTDVEIIMDVADFSSLLMGAVGYKDLFDYGLSDISSERYLDVVHNIFKVESKPICHTIF